MNNLDLVQEACLGLVADGYIPLDTGDFQCRVFKTRRWNVAIADDPLVYEFDTMAEAMDFVCAEARLAATVH